MTAAFPCVLPASLARYLGESGRDEYGNDVEAWAPWSPIRVFGWEPAKSTEPVLVGHERIVIAVKLYARKADRIGEHDRLILEGRVYDVVGEPEDPNNNPWFQPGLVTVNLRRVEG